MVKKYDFSGWATRNDLRCSDGRIIRKDAFKHNDGQKVPLVWGHTYNEPSNVLGHAILENRNDGVYAYCSFNDTLNAQDAKIAVQHGDLNALSIYANHLQQKGSEVLHGAIREVSLVLAGANPGAFIDSILTHGEDAATSEEAIIYTDEEIYLRHAEDPDEDKSEEDKKTIQDVLETLTEEQKKVVDFMVGQALQHGDSEKDDDPEDEEDEEDEEDDPEDNTQTDSKGGDKIMKHNAFTQGQDNQENTNNVLCHDDMEAIFNDAKRYGSLKDSVLTHGIEDIEYLFPDAKTVTNVPEFIKREMDWVNIVMKGVHHTPFSRIKSIFANITEDEARAKGYVKGSLKIEEVFTLLKRTTTPTTIYKKQDLDRDDVIDITDFDVVAWLKAEMRMMLDEEIARAILIGDGRPSSSNDKINEINVRPVWKDDDLYTIKHVISVTANATDDQKAKAFIRGAVKCRKNYKGSGNPVLFTTEDVLTDCLLMEDTTGRAIYDTEEKLRTALRVSKIVTVPVMENQTREVSGKDHTLKGLLINLNDYNVGADKGGAVNMFDDFDIDYNKQKYLIETRCSGALIRPYSAVALEEVVSA